MCRRKLIGYALLIAACSSGKESRDDRKFVVFEGTCDASGAVAIDSRLFAVADDENNVLRIYDADKGGKPIHAVDVTPELHLKKKKNPEADLEAATRVGGVAYWLSSHGRTKKGKRHPDRLKLFATNLPLPGAAITLQGAVYNNLLSDLLADARLARFDLHTGVNIEGMTAMPNGQLLLGFRKPVPQGKALLVPLLNKDAPLQGKSAQFGPPITLDLGGLGVRGLSFWHGTFLIAAGPRDQDGQPRIFKWAGGANTAPQALHGTTLGDLTPEAFFTPESRNDVLLLSDDGTRLIDGKRCKDLKDSSKMRFRGLWLRPG